MGTLQLISPICLFDFPCRCRVPSIFGKCCAAKYLAPCWSQSRATSQVHCMRQKQMSKLSSVSALLGKICASSALILQATYEEIIFILSNTSLKLVEAVNAWKVCKDWPLFKPREEKTAQTQSERDRVHLTLEWVAIYQQLQQVQCQGQGWTLCCPCHPQKQAERLLFPDCCGMI